MKNSKFIWKGIKLTDQAAKQIIFICSKNSQIKGLKLGIKTSGCAGFKYIIETVIQPNKDDIKFSYHEANLYVSPNSMPYIDGIEIDYVKDGLNQLFKFNNPKSQHLCGCGESFSIE